MNTHARSASSLLAIATMVAAVVAGPVSAADGYEVQEYALPPGSHPHDVAPGTDGGISYTGQHDGTLGLLDPASGEVTAIPLGPGSRPRGVIVGPHGAPWFTDSGLDAIVTLDPVTLDVTAFPLPDGRSGTSLNTATFDAEGGALVHRPGGCLRPARSD